MYKRQSWWWLAAGIASVRGVVLATFWVRVAAARHRTARTGRVTVLAAVCRDQVCPSARPTTPSWDELLVGGLLEADQDGWRWRPSILAWGGYSCLRLARRDVLSVSTAFAFDPGMPPGDYVQVTTQDGPPVDLLVWDYGRVPPIQAWLAPR